MGSLRPLYFTMMDCPSTSVTWPGRSAVITSAASIAARRSRPVPMNGASGTSRGTAWRCMLAPMSARLASSCSKNGIRAVATDTICFGDTSMSCTSSGGRNEICVVAPKNDSCSSCICRSSNDAACGDWRTSTRSLRKVPSGLSGALACAIT